MAPMYGHANFDFLDSDEDFDFDNKEPIFPKMTSSDLALYYTMFLLGLLLFWFIIYFLLRLVSLRQKTRDPQQSRVYVGSRRRPSLGHQPPTIYVSPANLPPPPKYEAMAPPSYDEVVGIHYPNYQLPINQAVAIQPITQPITAAVQAAQSSNAAGVTNQITVTNNTTSAKSNAEPTTVVTVTTVSS